MRLAPLVLVVLVAACGEPRPPAAVSPDGGPDAGACVVNDVPGLCARAGVTCGPAQVDCNGVQLGVDCGPCDAGPDSGPEDAGVDAGPVGDGGPPDGGCFATVDCGFNQHCENEVCVETPGSCSTPTEAPCPIHPPGVDAGMCLVHCPDGSRIRTVSVLRCDDCGDLPTVQCHLDTNPGLCASRNTCQCGRQMCMENCYGGPTPKTCAAGLFCDGSGLCLLSSADDTMTCLSQ